MSEFAQRIRFLAAGQDNPQSIALSECADRIEALERINRQVPAILEYLEEEARPIATDNGFVPNKALVLLNNLRMAIENTWID
jgi:hypothetical protein